ncbi:heme-binding protein HmuY [Leptospira langatensis]|uniref:Heme-binding protein HmuY n=1 Tax=Leptospira langatensis TaxID=2484983 RepID=A0A5F1ZTT1_9LEPT|nr:HmuY family protein [Leptospira langatensis]TGJ98857.1 heme-binding protein HmuY [Leptospira langatensis]TGL40576.1 heme-binding protein HmuY [Leptospira langatensis]
MKSIYSIIIIIIGVSLTFCGGPNNGGDDALSLLAASSEPVDPCLGYTGSSNTTGSSTRSTEVNASSESCWVYVDLKAGGGIVGKSGSWDMKFKRFVIGTNSGTSGSGSGGSCFNASNASLDDVNSSGCTLELDKEMTQTGGGGFGNADENASPSFWDWYDYDSVTHILTPKTRYYLVRASDGSTYFAVKMTGYYATVGGTSGYPQLQWKTVL